MYFSHDSFRETKYINEANSEILVAFNKMVKKVGEDIENFHFNTAISEMMIFINLVYKINEFNLDIMHKFAIILSCFAPYLAEEINEHLGFNTSICLMKHLISGKRTQIIRRHCQKMLQTKTEILLQLGIILH